MWRSTWHSKGKILNKLFHILNVPILIHIWNTAYEMLAPKTATVTPIFRNVCATGKQQLTCAGFALYTKYTHL